MEQRFETLRIWQTFRLVDTTCAYGLWTQVYNTGVIFDAVFAGRVHGRRYTLPVYTARRYGP